MHPSPALPRSHLPLQLLAQSDDGQAWHRMAPANHHIVAEDHTRLQDCTGVHCGPSTQQRMAGSDVVTQHNIILQKRWRGK